MNESHIIWILYQACDALAYTHKRQICHLDIKPENILIKDKLMVKLADFGIAKHFDDIYQGFRVGTYCYMSPEMCAAQPVTYKSDIWSLGVVIYELCALEKPFPFQNDTHWQLMLRIRNTAHERLTGYSDEFIWLVDRMLSKSAEERPSAEEIKAMPFVQQRLLYFLNNPIEVMGHHLTMKNMRSLGQARRLITGSDFVTLGDSPTEPSQKTTEEKLVNAY
jgi:NIMA (never in mitosis gene a)-related kinase